MGFFESLGNYHIPSHVMHVFSLREAYVLGTLNGHPLVPFSFERVGERFFWQVSPTSSFKILPRPDRKPPKPKLLQRMKQPLTEAFFLVSDFVFPGSVVRGKSMKDINVTKR